MAELNSDAIRREAAERLVDLAIVRSVGDATSTETMAVLLEAAALDPELLSLASEMAQALARSSPRVPILRAVDLLADACRHVGHDD